MWKVFRKKKKWTKAEEKKLLQLLDSLVEELDSDEGIPEAEDEEEEIVLEIKECSCSINELMKTGCQCGGV